MTSGPPDIHACWSCGTVLSTAGGRCPQCGAEQEVAEAPISSRQASPSLRPALEARRRAVKKKKLLSLVVLIFGLGIIGAIGFAFRPSVSTEPTNIGANAQAIPPVPAPPVPSSGQDLGIADPSSVGPMDLLGRAKTRALAWNGDTILVSISAAPVVKGKVDLTSGGAIEFVFGKPTGQGFGAGARVKPTGFAIRIDQSGTDAKERRLSQTRAAAEPNCTLAEAARSLSAAGVADDASLEFDYGYSARHDRTVWRAVIADNRDGPRTVDGWTCAIVVR